jgi:N6-L-threonylcarbamoyladenine synthase
MLILGIENTAHTFGIGIVDYKKKKILFNEKNVFSQEEGMNPRKLSDFHTKNFDNVLKMAKVFLKSIGKNFYDLDLIAFSRGPGIGNSLKIGGLVAKTLARKYNVKIIGINHIISHLELGKFVSNLKNPIFLNVTGVNSQIIAQDEVGNYIVYGETEDIGIGNLFDSIARLFSLGFPGGPMIEKRARYGKNFIKIPYCVKGMNISCSGIYSFIKTKWDKIRENKEEFINDICYSLQETCFAMLLEVVERAICLTEKKEFVIVGGVAANKRFMQMAKSLSKEKNIKLKTLPLNLCMDNGVQIAVCGGKYFKYARTNIKNLKSLPYIRVEDNIMKNKKLDN